MLLAHLPPLRLLALSLFAGRAVQAATPQAFSLPPTGNWDGNDGGWSTFAIRVGTPPQVFRILPSTSNSQIYIPLPDDCPSNGALCGSARGVEPFNAAFAGSSLLSGTPENVNGTSVDPGETCTLNRSPDCSSCPNEDGKCTSGPCSGRQCCGILSTCTSTCLGVAGICTGQFIGCPCTGPDYNAGPGVMATTSSDPVLAMGFQWNSSASWGSGSKFEPLLGLPLTLGIRDTGFFGSDTLGIGADPNSGLTISNQNVIGVNASSYYIGSLGLGMGPNNASLLGTLYNQKMIPSVSYGYTAGALYQSPPIFGSLTLGGYDTARTAFGPNLTSNLQSSDDSIMIGIGAITLSNALTPITTLLSIENNLTALVDTTLPYTYLPLYVCQQLEEAYGLQWDAGHQMYLINDTIHQQLLKNAPSMTFILSTKSPEPAALNITIPYAALDLSAAFPIFPNGTRYFPLRRANTSAQFILGRAFMQHTYLFVDYQASQFTLAQAAFPPSGTQNIMTVSHSGNGTGIGSPSSSNSGLSVGAIAGIAIGSSVATVILCMLAWLFWRVRRPRKNNRRRRRTRQDADVWRAPVSKGPSANSSGTGPEKGSFLTSNASSFTKPAAFAAYKSDKSRPRGQSDRQRQSRSTQPTTQSSMSSMGKLKMASWFSTGNSSKSSNSSKDLRSVRISHPTSPLHNGKAMEDVDDDPWQTSALNPPSKSKKAATPPTGHTRMFSILDDEPEETSSLKTPPRTQRSERPGLPKLNTAQEMYRAPKEWETPKEWDTMDVGWSPSPISPEKSQQRSSRPGPAGYSKSRQNSLNTIIVDSEPSRHGSKPSVSSEASKARQKHIWEMASPSSSRGGSPSRHRSRASHGGGAHPSIPEVPLPMDPESSTAGSQAPTPTVSPGPEGRRRHIWELQSPGGSSRGGSRKHSRTGVRDTMTRDTMIRDARSHGAETPPSTGAGMQAGGVQGATAALTQMQRQMADVESVYSEDNLPGMAM